MYRLLEDGKLSDFDLKSEYERGFVDCWNKYVYPLSNRDIEGIKKNMPDIFLM